MTHQTSANQTRFTRPTSRNSGFVKQSDSAKSPGIEPSGHSLSAMLNEEDRAILDFERGSWLEPGPKDQAIEMSLGLSAARYYERLRSLAVCAAALAYDPLTTKRVLAIIEEPTETGLAV
jgi:hypothetical protein